MLTTSDMTTRELMKAAQNARSYPAWEDGATYHVGTRLLKGGVVCSCFATLDEIIATLNTRPHVPSKREAKTIRRLRAQTGQTEAWLRAHPTYGQEIADAQFPDRRTISQREADQIAKYYGNLFGRMFKVV
jgi:hypothetical protein